MKRMKYWLLPVLLSLLLPAGATEIPDELWKALPEGTERIVQSADLSGGHGIAAGLSAIGEALRGQAVSVLRQRLRGAVTVLLAVLLCGAVDGFARSTGKPPELLPAVGALSVTLAAAGSLESLIGLGAGLVAELSDFSRVLLPALAAATALSGAVSSATVQQLAAVAFSDLLVHLIRKVLLPMVYLYIGALTAAACLPSGRLAGLAEAIRKAVTWTLSGALIAFTVYLSVVHVISGAADAAAVKLAKAAVSGVVPVVGGILSDAAETVLAGAGALRGTIGAFGTLAVLGACAWPFLNLGVQYLLYKMTAFLAGTVGPPELCRLIDGLGNAFGLLLGMTATCAVVVLISILSCVSAVMP